MILISLWKQKFLTSSVYITIIHTPTYLVNNHDDEPRKKFNLSLIKWGFEKICLKKNRRIIQKVLKDNQISIKQNTNINGTITITKYDNML